MKAEKHLTGTRRTELTAVTETLHQIAASGALTASRLPALFLTLNQNLRWWTTGPLLVSGQRIEFPGSQLVWEYYPGQGIQLQVLGTFGKADGLFTAGPSHYAQLTSLLAQMIPLAAKRANGMTWEYYFSFDGGSPPWTSAMSQATGLEALTRAFKATGNEYYLNTARRALPVFTRPPPAGVAVKTGRGIRFLQYTFAPSVSIINAFLQTLIGLDDYALESDNPEAMSLFEAGNAEAMAEVPHFDTGAWSLYQPGVEDDLSYHELVTGFLGAVVLDDRRVGLLHHGQALQGLREDAADAHAADHDRPRAQDDHGPLPAVEDLPGGDRDRAGRENGLRDERHAPVRRRPFHGSGAEARRHLHRPHVGDRPRRQLRADLRDAAGRLAPVTLAQTRPGRPKADPGEQ